MLKIKLSRFGKKGQPHYRVVVNEARSKRDGKYIALLGHYAPVQTPKILEIDLEAYADWIKKGAKPTETVDQLVARLKSGNPFPNKKKKLSKKAIAKQNAPAEVEPSSPATSETEGVADDKEAAERRDVAGDKKASEDEKVSENEEAEEK